MKWTEYLANSLYKEGIVSKDDKDIVQYGLESIEGNLLGCILVLFIGICFGYVYEALFLWIGLFFLRKNAGGFHATTKIRCVVITAGMFIIAFCIFGLFDYGIYFYILCVGVMGSSIWAIAPIDNPVKPLDAVEYKVFRKRSRIILCMESMLFLLAIYFQWKVLIRSVAMVFFIAFISLLLGIIKNGRTCNSKIYRNISKS